MIVNDKFYTDTLPTLYPNTLDTQLAEGIRVGKTFYQPDQRYLSARVSCIQLYDVAMSLDEMRNLREKCNDIRNEVKGTPNGLVLMFPFNRQSQCKSSKPIGKAYQLQGAECTLVTGPRMREQEAVRIETWSAYTDSVLYPMAEPVHTGSFTLLLYLRLDQTSGKFSIGPSKD